MEFRMGIQSYSLRGFDFEQAVAVTSELNLGYLEVYPGHLPPDRGRVVHAKGLLEKHGIRMIAYGVVHLTGDEGQTRPLFEFAREMGIEMLSADPESSSFDLLDRLVGEFGVAIGIHNHGPGHRYADVRTIEEAIERHNESIGVCLDTGHLARVGEDPIEAVYALKGRLHGVHLKDVDRDGRDVVVGTGVLDVEGFLKALEDIGFKGPMVLEYELQPEDPIPGISRSLEFVQARLRAYEGV
ncbi:MAG TPA: sugar phosphate isomerase/epimerase [Candidatus Latescibacteria bacterium]|nr:sugar phosphate isomerase/epimerase [Candidatus Latescibacterota bacterium]